jgi:hypothetical protein
VFSLCLLPGIDRDSGFALARSMLRWKHRAVVFVVGAGDGDSKKSGKSVPIHAIA